MSAPLLIHDIFAARLPRDFALYRKGGVLHAKESILHRKKHLTGFCQNLSENKKSLRPAKCQAEANAPSEL